MLGSFHLSSSRVISLGCCMTNVAAKRAPTLQKRWSQTIPHKTFLTKNYQGKTFEFFRAFSADAVLGIARRDDGLTQVKSDLI